MDRRGFFKFSTGVVLLPTLTSVHAAEVDLGFWVEEHFNCKFGLPAPWVSEEHKKDPAYQYVSIMVGVKNTNESDAKRQITSHIIEKLQPLAKNKPDLWWRIKPIWVEDTNRKLGETWLTKDEYEDFPAYVEQRERHKRFIAQGKPTVSTFLGKPGWENIEANNEGYPVIPENVAFDEVSDCYRYVTQGTTEHVHYVRMRIAIPEKHEVLNDLFATDNAKIRNI